VITHAFTTLAPDRAGQVADDTVDFALAGFDGAFLAFQANPAVAHERLMEQLAVALSSLGREALRA
jgi:hypothetical protein